MSFGKYNSTGYEAQMKSLAQLLGGAGGPPISTIKELRGKRSQQSVATQAGLSRSYLALLEGGHKRLTTVAAKSLGPALGVQPGHLEIAEMLSSVRRRALKSEIEPYELLALIERMEKKLPDGELGEKVFDAMIMILDDALKKYTPKHPIKFDTTPKKKAATKVAAKSARSAKSSTQNDRRDTFGRQRQKQNSLPDGS